MFLLLKRKRVSIPEACNLIQAEYHGTFSNEENKITINEDETESQNNDVDSFNQKTEIPNVSKLGELQLTFNIFFFILHRSFHILTKCLLLVWRFCFIKTDE